MTYTANPELDAARHEDELEAADDFQQEAEREAPGIVFKKMQAINTPKGWFDHRKFIGRYSVEEILRDAMDGSDDDTCDAYFEFMAEATKEAKEKMLQAMATWFCKTWAYEVYTEHLESLK